MQIDIDKFIFAVQGPLGKLSTSQIDGLKTLLDFIQKDMNIVDIRFAGYMLATVYHETGHTFLPIEEYGKGKGHKYGEIDPVTHKAYYGRGYVQLTWKDNYKEFSIILKLDLVSNPELVLDPLTAYKIMSIGMRKGSFTGVSLNKYFNETKDDPINARKIINGLDCAERIANYYKIFLQALKDSIIKGGA